MALNADEKAKIIAAYEPILYLHPDEKFVPINPRTYIESSMLWPSQPGEDIHEKDNWGEFLTHPAFPASPARPGYPRRPSILRGGLSLNPAHDVEGNSDPTGDGIPDWYLGHQDPNDTRGPRPYLVSNRNRALFLSNAGWLNDADNVTETSVNDQPNLDAVQQRWDNESKLRDGRHWYYAEVEELDTLTDLIGRIKGEKGLDVGAILNDLLFGGGSWIIWYYFLYPMHLESTRLCEQVAESGNNGNYEGDWNAIGIMVRREGALPWDRVTFPEPEFVGFGLRGRGFVENLVPFFRQQMAVYRWGDIQRVGRHLKAYVSLGSHNTYYLPGPQPSPSYSDSACGTVEEVAEAIEELEEDIEELKDTVTTIAVTVAKVGAGAAIGAIFGGPIGAAIGAVVGGIAAAVEAAASGSDEESTPDTVPQPNTPDDEPPLPNQYGLVIAPQSLVSDPTVTANTTAAEPWAKASTEAEVKDNHLVNREGSQQIWWPPTKSREDIGYDGRWGVVVTADPRDRRSGITFPDFKTAFLIDFVASLHGET